MRRGIVGSPNNPFASGDANPFAGGSNPYAPPTSPNPYQQPQGGNPFNSGDGYPPASAPSSSSTTTFSGPPTGLLIAAAGVAVLGVAIGVASLFMLPWLSIVGWALAGPIAIGLMALYLSRDTARRSAAIYMRPDWVGPAYAGVAVLFVIAVLFTAYAVANWVGHL